MTLLMKLGKYFQHERTVTAESLDWYLHRWTKHGTTFSQPASFWSLSIFDQAGVFDESFNYSFDYEFFVRMYSTGTEWIDSEGTYAAFRVHPNSKTISADLSFVEEDYKNRKKILASK